jgi:[acyl-carrier-protein] S-malonyltransferase
MTRPLALLFPGQNSRYPSMLRRLVASDRANAEWIARASAAVGRDLTRHYHPDNPTIFARNRDVQVGVFLANHLHWQALERAGVRADCSAGLSLGEYNHLVHIGALTFDDAVRLLDARGIAYEQGPAGKMVAIFPIDVREIDELASEIGIGDRVGVAMINSPRQVVLAGEAAAVDAAALTIEDAFGTERVVVDHALPMHSPLFRGVGDALRPVLEAIDWRPPTKRYLPNVCGRFAADHSPRAMVESLARHVWNTVRWRDSVESIVAAARDTIVVEAGPKTILTGMFGKRWLSPTRFATDAGDDVHRAVAAIVEELTRESDRAADAR